MEYRRNLQIDVDTLNEKIISLEEQLYESKNIQLDLLERLKEMEIQLTSSLTTIVKLRAELESLKNGEAIYIGKKGDRLDMQLARAINQYPEREKMKILFIRESEGVYHFGSKRVYIRIGKGDQVMVRVGGGYMKIDDFIEQYTMSEVEKIDRRDVAVRISNKLSV